jgi:large subunit ribosomal protein L1
MTQHNNHSLVEAITLTKSSARAKFVESIDMICQLNIDPKQSTQMIRSSSKVIPGTVRPKTVIAVCEPELAQNCVEAGADMSGAEEVISSLENMKLDRRKHVVLCTPSMIKPLSKLGKKLGSRGVMPNAKLSTLTSHITAEIPQAKNARVYYRTDRYGTVHCQIGNCQTEDEHLIANIKSVVQDLISLKPTGVKGSYIKFIGITSTMGKFFQIDLKDIL